MFNFLVKVFRGKAGFGLANTVLGQVLFIMYFNAESANQN